MRLDMDIIEVLGPAMPSLYRFTTSKFQNKPAVVVTAVTPSSARGSGLLNPGTVVETVGGQSIHTITDLERAFTKALTGEKYHEMCMLTTQEHNHTVEIITTEAVREYIANVNHKFPPHNGLHDIIVQKVFGPNPP